MRISRVLSVLCTLFAFSAFYIESSCATKEKAAKNLDSIDDDLSDSNTNLIRDKLLNKDSDGINILDKQPDNSHNDEVSMIKIENKGSDKEFTFYYENNCSISSKYIKKMNNTPLEYNFFKQYSNLNAIIMNDITMDSEFAKQLEQSAISESNLRHIIINNCIIKNKNKDLVEHELKDAFFGRGKTRDFETISLGFINSEYFPVEFLRECSSKEKNVKNLKIEANEFSQEIGSLVGTIIIENKGLTTLGLGAKKISTNALESVANNMSKEIKLSTLDLSLGILDDSKDTQDLFIALCSNQNLKESLKSLRLSLNSTKLGKKELETCREIGNFLTHVDRVENLVISGIKASNNCIYAIINGLPENANIKLFAFEDIKLNVKDYVSHLAKKIEKMTELSTLMMRGCSLDSASQTILDSIKSSYVKQIYLDRNNISSINISKNIIDQEIEYLSLFDNALDKDAIVKIYKAFSNADNRKNCVIVNANCNKAFVTSDGKRDNSLYNFIMLERANEIASNKKANVIILSN